MAQKCRVSQELASGGELFSKVADEGQLPMDLARRYFAQVLAGAAHCHNHGVAHRDLKLENVSEARRKKARRSAPSLDYRPSAGACSYPRARRLTGWCADSDADSTPPPAAAAALDRGPQLMLDASGDRVMITDFGFAKNFWQSTPKTCLGTAAYVAPEVLELEPYDGTKVDAWACGMRKRYFLLRRFNVKTIILPRQARDKHRESTQKRAPFSCRRHPVCYARGRLSVRSW